MHHNCPPLLISVCNLSFVQLYTNLVLCNIVHKINLVSIVHKSGIMYYHLNYSVQETLTRHVESHDKFENFIFHFEQKSNFSMFCK